jgi:hypothetical protein
MLSQAAGYSPPVPSFCNDLCAAWLYKVIAHERLALSLSLPVNKGCSKEGTMERDKSFTF